MNTAQFLESVIAEHLPGEHDQSKHGRRGAESPDKGGSFGGKSESPRQALRKFGYSVDNPGGSWLGGEKKRAIEKAEKGLVGGSITATADTIPIRINKLIKLPGQNNEHLRMDSELSQNKISVIADDIKKNGFKQDYGPLIWVNVNGKATVAEGNHRIRAAKKAGLAEVPTQIRWFAGSEQGNHSWSAESIVSGLRESVITEHLPGEHDQSKHGRRKVGASKDSKKPRQKQTDTPEFKKWFGDSKVTDINNEPLVVFHGTNQRSAKSIESSTFLASKGGMLLGWFDRKAERANGYAVSFDESYNEKTDGSIFPVFLKMENPKFFTSEYKFPTTKSEIEKLIDEGFDGLATSNLTVFATFDARNIKSATGNRGAFDPENPDIRESFLESVITEHLPGKHEQKNHGRRGGAGDAKELSVAVAEHLGPGPHPSGTPQSVHGGGGGDGEEAPQQGRETPQLHWVRHADSRVWHDLGIENQEDRSKIRGIAGLMIEIAELRKRAEDGEGVEDFNERKNSLQHEIKRALGSAEAGDPTRNKHLLAASNLVTIRLASRAAEIMTPAVLGARDGAEKFVPIRELAVSARSEFFYIDGEGSSLKDFKEAIWEQIRIVHFEGREHLVQDDLHQFEHLQILKQLSSFEPGDEAVNFALIEGEIEKREEHEAQVERERAASRREKRKERAVKRRERRASGKPSRFADWIKPPEGGAKWEEDREDKWVSTFEVEGAEYTAELFFSEFDPGQFDIPTEDLDFTPTEASFQFSDADGSFSVTGAGNARKVFKRVVQELSEGLKRADSATPIDVLTYTASEKSRKSLYRFLTSRASDLFPHYIGLEMTDNPGHFALVDRDVFQSIPAEQIERVTGGVTVLSESDQKLDTGSDDFLDDPDFWDELFRELRPEGDEKQQKLFDDEPEPKKKNGVQESIDRAQDDVILESWEDYP